MRNIDRILSIGFSTTAFALASTLLPGDFAFQASSKYLPQQPPPPPSPQQAAAYSPMGGGVPLNSFELEYDQIWHLIDKFFLYRERLGSWSLWEHRYDGALSTSEQARAAIDAMIGSLKDDYTFYRDTSQTAERRAEDELRNTVSCEMLPGEIGYIHLSSFNSRSCVEEMKNCLQELKPARGLIFDLRRNKGGSINNAFRIFELMVNTGVFVRTDGFCDAQPEQEQMLLTRTKALIVHDAATQSEARDTNVSGSKPMIVLVDHSTKSAAEMLAGALRDNHRARLIGERTYGKGVVQRVWEFDDGTSIKITAARYCLPSGKSVQDVGLSPDCLVPKRQGQDGPLRQAVLELRRMSPT